MKKYFIYAAYTLIVVLLIVGCENKKDELSATQEEIIAVHDEVMPKMSELRKVMKQLEARADSLIGMDSVAMLQANTLLNLASDISQANESMMVWMRSFDPTLIDTEKDHQKAIEYLQDQKLRIEKVKEDMLNTLEAGKKGLEGN